MKNNKLDYIINRLNQIIVRLKNHHIDSFSAQIAFYMLLSIFPFLIVLFMVLTNLSVSYAEQLDSVYKLIPTEAATIIKDYLEYSASITSGGKLTSLVFVALWMSSNAMTALMKSFNMAYDIIETRGYFKKKILGMLCSILTIILIISALIIPNAGVNFMAFIRKYIEIPEMDLYIFNIIKWALSIVGFIITLGGLYIILPNKRVTIKEAMPGATMAFLGLVLNSFLFSYFVKEYSRYSIVYGGLAAVIILLMWLFLCGIILMLGVEINSFIQLKKVNRKKIQKNVDNS